MQAREFKVYVLTTFCLHFMLSDTQVLSLLEELSIAYKICKEGK